MINLDKIENVYIFNQYVDMRKSITGLSVIVDNEFKGKLFTKSIFVFTNRTQNRMKILHYDNGFWLYYRVLDNGKFKWPTSYQGEINIGFDELKWLINGHELRLEETKFEVKNKVDFY